MPHVSLPDGRLPKRLWRLYRVGIARTAHSFFRLICRFRWNASRGGSRLNESIA